MASGTEPPAGLLAALKAVAATLLATGRTRLELLGNELEVQKLQALRLLLLAQAMLFCAGVGLVLLVLLLSLLAWEHRIALMAVLALAFLAAAYGFWRALQRLIEHPEPAFGATLAELREDIRQLKRASAPDADARSPR